MAKSRSDNVHWVPVDEQALAQAGTMQLELGHPRNFFMHSKCRNPARNFSIPQSRIKLTLKVLAPGH